MSEYPSVSLDLDALRIWRGVQTLVSEVSVTLQAGRVLKLTGPNGAGKTTLLKCLAGIHRDWSGKILWNQQETRFLPGAARTLVIGHQNALKTVWTPRQNLANLAPDVTSDKIEAALNAFEVGHLADIPVRHLSAGQTRRTCLARLALISADLWLLDEPGVSLDVAGRGLLAEHIQDFQARGGIVVAATHGDVSLPDAIELQFATPTAEEA